MSQAVDRSVPNWGQAHPLPELEDAIASYLQARKTWDIDDPRWKPTCTQASARVDFIGEAHRLLAVEASMKSGGGWNATVDALDRYRADWRGEVVPVRQMEVA